MQPLTRRHALALATASLAAAVLPRGARAQPDPKAAGKPTGPLFPISLAQWSLHRELHGGKLTNLDFPAAARDRYGIDAVEYVSGFFKSAKAEHVAELHKRCADAGVRSLLIMCDGEGALGDKDEKKRSTAVENHRKWVEAAKALGCHSIRVNAQSEGAFEEQQKLAADGLRALSELADVHGINVIVENHGGLSSNGAWLTGVIKRVDHPRCGTLPDFGNFRISDKESYDRYQGMKELMPFAKGVSAKSYDFNKEGEETTIDYRRMLGIVLDAGYRGHIGIEYEGSRMSEHEGIIATKKLLEALRTELSAKYSTPAR